MAGRLSRSWICCQHALEVTESPNVEDGDYTQQKKKKKKKKKKKPPAALNVEERRIKAISKQASKAISSARTPLHLPTATLLT